MIYSYLLFLWYVRLDRTGVKEVLGMWIGQGESSSFWMGILTDLKARGVEDVLITITDNLNDFTYIIKTVFPIPPPDMCCASDTQFLQVCGFGRI